MSWIVPFTHLTDIQRRAVQLSPERHRIFSGPPGSGKSIVLLHRAAYLRNQYQIPEERLRVFVYTNALKRYLCKEAHLVGLSPSVITTFDSWCLQMARKYLGRLDPSVDFPEVRSKLAAALERQADRRFLFDAVFVDEGQDLDEAAYRILVRVSAHITVCTDPNQQIYKNGSSDADIARWLGISPSRVAFLDAFRCSPLISQLASLYLAPGFSRDVFLRQVRQQQGEREMPVLFVAVSHEQERERLVRIGKTRLAKGEKVGVLVPSKSLIAPIREEANRHGVGTCSRGEEGDGTNLSILTYHSAKGLVFDSVLLPHVWEGAFRHGDDSAWERLLFVGITRARKWVYISTVSSPDSSLFAPLARLLTEPVVEVQWGAELASAQPRDKVSVGGSLRDLV